MYEQLITDIRMKGFNKPIINYNEYLKKYTVFLENPSGIWTKITGDTQSVVLARCIKWINENQKIIIAELKTLEISYLRLKGYYGNRNKNRRRTRKTSK